MQVRPVTTHFEAFRDTSVTRIRGHGRRWEKGGFRDGEGRRAADGISGAQFPGTTWLKASGSTLKMADAHQRQDSLPPSPSPATVAKAACSPLIVPTLPPICRGCGFTRPTAIPAAHKPDKRKRLVLPQGYSRLLAQSLGLVTRDAKLCRILHSMAVPKESDVSGYFAILEVHEKLHNAWHISLVALRLSRKIGICPLILSYGRLFSFSPLVLPFSRTEKFHGEHIQPGERLRDTDLFHGSLTLRSPGRLP